MSTVTSYRYCYSKEYIWKGILANAEEKLRGSIEAGEEEQADQLREAIKIIETKIDSGEVLPR